VNKYLLYSLVFFGLIGHPLTSKATTLEEQANNIESSKNKIHKEISDIFNKYKKSLQITTSQPNVVDSNGHTVMISMDVVVKLTAPDLSLQLADAMNRYFRIYTRGNEDSYLEVSIVSGGNREAWDELTQNGLLAEISFLESMQSIPLFGNFSNWFTVKITTNEVFKMTFIVDKKNIKLNPTPTIKLVTKSCDKNGIKENSCDS